jgi:hypothetical protein
MERIEGNDKIELIAVGHCTNVGLIAGIASRRAHSDFGTQSARLCTVHRFGRAKMLPRTIQCEICGETARVRAYGRVVYESEGAGQVVVEPKIHSVHLTVDCPRCGVQVQIYYPNAQRGRPSAATR